MVEYLPEHLNKWLAIENPQMGKTKVDFEGSDHVN